MAILSSLAPVICLLQRHSYRAVLMFAGQSILDGWMEKARWYGVGEY